MKQSKIIDKICPVITRKSSDKNSIFVIKNLPNKNRWDRAYKETSRALSIISNDYMMKPKLQGRLLARNLKKWRNDKKGWEKWNKMNKMKPVNRLCPQQGELQVLKLLKNRNSWLVLIQISITTIAKQLKKRLYL